MLVVAWPIFAVSTEMISGYNLVDSSLFNFENSVVEIWR